MPPDKKGRKHGRQPQPSAPVAGTHRRDPGPPYVVRWHPDAAAERDSSWPPGEHVAMDNAVEKLEGAGPRLPFPHSSAVKGPAGKGFRELRPRAGRSRWRPIYRQVNATTFVVFAVGPEATLDKAAFDKALRRAIQRSAESETS